MLILTLSVVVVGTAVAIETCSSHCHEYATVTLSNQVKMPVVGFGTAAMHGPTTAASVKTAVKAGFRMFDGAEAEEWYDDEALGKALHAMINSQVVQREDLFIVSKIHPKNLGTTKTKTALDNMFERFEVEFIDLVLLHFPECGHWIPSCNGVVVEGTWEDSYAVLQRYYNEGVLGAIGVSNFNILQLRQLVDSSLINPHVVQNYMTPLHKDLEVREFCRAQGIHYVGYSTLNTDWEERKPQHRIMLDIANKHDSSVVDVTLSWAIQRGMGVLPRSTNEIHIHENAKFHCKERTFLLEGDLALIDKLE